MSIMDSKVLLMKRLQKRIEKLSYERQCVQNARDLLVKNNYIANTRYLNQRIIELTNEISKLLKDVLSIKYMIDEANRKGSVDKC